MLKATVVILYGVVVLMATSGDMMLIDELRFNQSNLGSRKGKVT
jgi:hypothetical protein